MSMGRERRSATGRGNLTGDDLAANDESFSFMVP
jgi:hypothetical protein